ncbi:DUF6578 domain-containing protein [Cryobacterium sp. M91]|uniref:DUF6578 domain-containing protein n=1 Tax=Cryobacterium sp. M91 TaxID=2048294 RepID=UPI000CE42ECA|nr:DUF6578 domain-containing protein [Cryobacterium sp. M91]
MTIPAHEPSPENDAVTSQDPEMHVYSTASYESFQRQHVGTVEAEDIDVWFTEWQVAEDGLNVELDERVRWDLVPMDQDWVARLFAGRRTVPLQLDTYADAGCEASDLAKRTLVAGRVARIDQVSVRYEMSTGPVVRGLVPLTGGAMQHSVLSLRQLRAHHGTVVGWIVRVRT